MAKAKDTFLLNRYFNIGWLMRAYYTDDKFIQPYSAEDRLYAGKRFYGDFLKWRIGNNLVRNYAEVKVDVSRSSSGGIMLGMEAERFRRALRCIPKSSLSVIYKIVLTEEEIKPVSSMSAREKLYFNDEIKGLLCRGLDSLCQFYVLNG